MRVVTLQLNWFPLVWNPSVLLPARGWHPQLNRLVSTHSALLSVLCEFRASSGVCFCDGCFNNQVVEIWYRASPAGRGDIPLSALL